MQTTRTTDMSYAAASSGGIDRVTPSIHLTLLGDDLTTSAAAAATAVDR